MALTIDCAPNEKNTSSAKSQQQRVTSNVTTKNDMYFKSILLIYMLYFIGNHFANLQFIEKTTMPPEALHVQKSILKFTSHYNYNYQNKSPLSYQ